MPWLYIFWWKIKLLGTIEVLGTIDIFHQKYKVFHLSKGTGIYSDPSFWHAFWKVQCVYYSWTYSEPVQKRCPQILKSKGITFKCQWKSLILEDFVFFNFSEPFLSTALSDSPNGRCMYVHFLNLNNLSIEMIVRKLQKYRKYQTA